MVQRPAKAEGAAATLPKELEPFRKQLDDLALKLASQPEVMEDPVKLKAAIYEGIKSFEGFPPDMIEEGAWYVEKTANDAYSSGKDKFGVYGLRSPTF